MRIAANTITVKIFSGTDIDSVARKINFQIFLSQRNLNDKSFTNNSRSQLLTMLVGTHVLLAIKVS